MQSGLLLDRDGIINRRIIGGYVRRPAEFVLLPEIIPLLDAAREAKMIIAVITNQQGVGKGLMSESDLAIVHDEMTRQLKNHGHRLDAIYHCADLASTGSWRRKPNPGMIEEAIADFDLATSRSWMIGDSITDAQAGRAAGIHTALVGDFPKDAATIVVPSLRHLPLETICKR
ncbi:MAG: HAD-IIIA family hydrolase [Candidatus Kapabacteria bacterium]|nr:HAD-IIIA family hydrolase [Candidatus Kapabacteria bacterium]